MGEKCFSVEASLSALDTVVGNLEEFLDMEECPMKLVMKMAVCLEEAFVNVANYAYKGTEYEGTKDADASFVYSVSDSDVEGFQKKLTIQMEDHGVPFNPLEKEDPDITLSADERPIGGLGIYMVKQSMDTVDYAYIDGKNIFTMTKNW